MLRAESRQDSELGRTIRETLAAGKYVSDDTVNMIVLQQLERSPGSGLILDGYPRTVAQAVYLEQALLDRGYPLPQVVHLVVPTDQIVRRLSSRAMCFNCQQIFNLLQKPPRVAGVCDDCTQPLVRRDDDTPDVILDRLRTYRDLTGPVLAYYTGANYHPVDGDRSSDTVFEEIQRMLEPARRQWEEER
jgi:adenylate kinase